MTLKPGIRIGPYEILSPLSVVGLGDIHRARDHEQGRDVVIQVLRIATDADPALLPRLAADVLGSARASRRLKDVLAACTSYEAVLETWGAGPGAPPEIAEAQTYIDTVCMSAEVPDADAPG
jgi:hypothetical protein